MRLVVGHASAVRQIPPPKRGGRTRLPPRGPLVGPIQATRNQSHSAQFGATMTLMDLHRGRRLGVAGGLRSVLGQPPGAGVRSRGMRRRFPRDFWRCGGRCLQWSERPPRGLDGSGDLDARATLGGQWHDHGFVPQPLDLTGFDRSRCSAKPVDRHQLVWEQDRALVQTSTSRIQRCRRSPRPSGSAVGRIRTRHRSPAAQAAP
jgi:hypothetical protein